MNEENNKLPLSARFKLISVILPIVNIAVMCLGLYFSPNKRIVDTLSALAYIACFDFIYLFFIEITGKVDLNNHFTPFLCVLAPVMCFYSVNIHETVFIVIICIIFLVLIAGLVSFSLSTVILLGLSGFCALFIGNIFVEMVPYLICIFLLCLTAEYVSDTRTLIYAGIAEVVFYFIVMIVTSGFVLKHVFSAENILICFICIIITIATVMIKKFLEATAPATITDAADSIFEKEKAYTSQETVDAISKSKKKQSNKAQNDAEDSGKKSSESFKTAKTEPSVISDIYFKEMEETVRNNNAMIMSLQEQLKNSADKYRELEDNFRRLAANTDCRLSTLISPDYSYSVKLKGKLPKLFHHCIEIARLSSEAAELINCNSELAFTIGLYHEYSRFLGENGSELLINEYHVPVYIIKLIDQIKDKTNTSPISREAGIVLLSDDIINTANYVRNSKNDVVSFERIVNNTFRVRKDQNFLRLAGLSNEEVQLLKLYYSDIGGANDTSD